LQERKIIDATGEHPALLLQVEALMAALDARAVVALYIYTFINHFVY
jgi:hypothetical protein